MGWKCEKFQPECCEADFVRIKILGYPSGRSASFFGIHLFRLVPGLKLDFFEKLPQVSRGAEMVAAKNCSNFWGEKIVQTSGAQIQANCPRMLRGRFWLQNQDFGASVGAICIIFRATSFRPVPRSQGPRGPGSNGPRVPRSQGLKIHNFLTSF